MSETEAQINIIQNAYISSGLRMTIYFETCQLLTFWEQMVDRKRYSQHIYKYIFLQFSRLTVLRFFLSENVEGDCVSL